MLEEIDHEQYQEWCEFFSLEPQGWQALRRVATRLSFWTAQVRTKNKLRERDFELKIVPQSHSIEVERARWEAMAIRQNLQDAQR